MLHDSYSTNSIVINFSNTGVCGGVINLVIIYLVPTILKEL